MKRMIVLLLLAGCDSRPPSTSYPANVTRIVYAEGLNFYRIYDTDKGVTCWAMEGLNGRSGLHCMTDKEISK